MTTPVKMMPSERRTAIQLRRPPTIAALAVYGAVLIGVMLAAPQGLQGLLNRGIQPLRRRLQ